MKRKELYNYIRGEIINELAVNEGTSEENAAKAAELKSIDAQIKALTAKKTEVTKSGAVSEADIDEARKPGAYSKGSKFEDAKEIYAVGIYADILKAIEDAGESGLTQKGLGAALGKGDGSSLNPILKKFKTIGVLAGGPLAAAAKPEKGAEEEAPEVEEPETEEPVDTWEKPEEEEPETGEEEPAAVSDKETEKVVGKAYAELSPEEEDVFNKFKQAIINKVKVLTDKKASKDDKTKAQAAIDNYKSKADLKKIFAKKGLNIIDFINGELKK